MNPAVPIVDTMWNGERLVKGDSPGLSESSASHDMPFSTLSALADVSKSSVVWRPDSHAVQMNCDATNEDGRYSSGQIILFVHLLHSTTGAVTETPVAFNLQ